MALFDGAGSWGPGAEAAIWVRDQLRSRWAKRSRVRLDLFRADLTAAASSLPQELRGEEGDEFSVAALLLDEEGIQFCAAGRYGALHVTPHSALALHSPASWVMEQVTAGILTKEEALEHPLREVASGAHVSAEWTDLATNVPIWLAPGESIVVADLRLFYELARRPVSTWGALPASELQKLFGEENYKTVIRVSA